MTNGTITSNPIAFPRLGAHDLALLKSLSDTASFSDGQIVFLAGDVDLDLFIVETGGIKILNPADDNRHIVTHGPGQFAGDIDLLTHRPVIVTGVACGQTQVLRIQSSRLYEILNKVPHLAELLLIAIQERRRLLMETGVLGLKIVGPGKCRDTMLVREFLFKNFVPFTWYDSTSDQGKKLLNGWGSPKELPVIECSNGQLLVNPKLRELALKIGVWRHCPSGETDLAIVGAGPAGMTAAVYAASEGLSTIVFDSIGPGGQASGSSKIENFIGFPSGLTGTELGTRSVLQMLKFGAKMVAPVSVERIEPAKTPDDFHTLHLDCGNILLARTVLIAAGVHLRKLEASNAERYESAGIHYACTTVEAILYDKQDVAVVGAGNSAGQAAMFLSDCCEDRTVHLIVRKQLGPTMSDYLVDRIREAPNIVLHEGVEIAAVHGDRGLEGITLRTYDPNSGASRGEESGETIPVSAVFVFIGADPGCYWLPETLARDSLGYIMTGVDALKSGHWPLKERDPCPLETTIPGILAAGDIRKGSTKRVGFAVGDGSLAVTCIHSLVAIRPEFTTEK
jgi:thioredoxin reductase (NADPH)